MICFLFLCIFLLLLFTLQKPDQIIVFLTPAHSGVGKAPFRSLPCTFASANLAFLVENTQSDSLCVLFQG